MPRLPHLSVHRRYPSSPDSSPQPTQEPTFDPSSSPSVYSDFSPVHAVSAGAGKESGNGATSVVSDGVGAEPDGERGARKRFPSRKPSREDNAAATAGRSSRAPSPLTVVPPSAVHRSRSARFLRGSSSKTSAGMGAASGGGSSGGLVGSSSGFLGLGKKKEAPSSAGHAGGGVGEDEEKASLSPSTPNTAYSADVSAGADPRSASVYSFRSHGTASTPVDSDVSPTEARITSPSSPSYSSRFAGTTGLSSSPSLRGKEKEKPKRWAGDRFGDVRAIFSMSRKSSAGRSRSVTRGDGDDEAERAHGLVDGEDVRDEGQGVSRQRRKADLVKNRHALPPLPLKTGQGRDSIEPSLRSASSISSAPASSKLIHSKSGPSFTWSSSHRSRNRNVSPTLPFDRPSPSSSSPVAAGAQRRGRVESTATTTSFSTSPVADVPRPRSALAGPTRRSTRSVASTKGYMDALPPTPRAMSPFVNGSRGELARSRTMARTGASASTLLSPASPPLSRPESALARLDGARPDAPSSAVRMSPPSTTTTIASSNYPSPFPSEPQDRQHHRESLTLDPTHPVNASFRAFVRDRMHDPDPLTRPRPGSAEGVKERSTWAQVGGGKGWRFDGRAAGVSVERKEFSIAEEGKGNENGEVLGRNEGGAAEDSGKGKDKGENEGEDEENSRPRLARQSGAEEPLSAALATLPLDGIDVALCDTSVSDSDFDLVSIPSAAIASTPATGATTTSDFLSPPDPARRSRSRPTVGLSPTTANLERDRSTVVSIAVLSTVAAAPGSESVLAGSADARGGATEGQEALRGALDRRISFTNGRKMVLGPARGSGSDKSSATSSIASVPGTSGASDSATTAAAAVERAPVPAPGAGGAERGGGQEGGATSEEGGRASADAGYRERQEVDRSVNSGMANQSGRGQGDSGQGEGAEAVAGRASAPRPSGSSRSSASSPPSAAARLLALPLSAADSPLRPRARRPISFWASETHPSVSSRAPNLVVNSPTCPSTDRHRPSTSPGLGGAKVARSAGHVRGLSWSSSGSPLSGRVLRRSSSTASFYSSSTVQDRVPANGGGYGERAPLPSGSSTTSSAGLTDMVDLYASPAPSSLPPESATSAKASATAPATGLGLTAAFSPAYSDLSTQTVSTDWTVFSDYAEEGLRVGDRLGYARSPAGAPRTAALFPLAGSSPPHRREPSSESTERGGGGSGRLSVDSATSPKTRDSPLPPLPSEAADEASKPRVTDGSSLGIPRDDSDRTLRAPVVAPEQTRVAWTSSSAGARPALPPKNPLRLRTASGSSSARAEGASRQLAPATVPPNTAAATTGPAPTSADVREAFEAVAEGLSLPLSAPGGRASFAPSSAYSASSSSSTRPPISAGASGSPAAAARWRHSYASTYASSLSSFARDGPGSAGSADTQNGQWVDVPGSGRSLATRGTLATPSTVTTVSIPHDQSSTPSSGGSAGQSSFQEGTVTDAPISGPSDSPQQGKEGRILSQGGLMTSPTAATLSPLPEDVAPPPRRTPRVPQARWPPARNDGPRGTKYSEVSTFSQLNVDPQSFYALGRDRITFAESDADFRGTYYSEGGDTVVGAASTSREQSVSGSTPLGRGQFVVAAEEEYVEMEARRTAMTSRQADSPPDGGESGDGDGVDDMSKRWGWTAARKSQAANDPNLAELRGLPSPRRRMFTFDPRNPNAPPLTKNHPPDHPGAEQKAARDREWEGIKDLAVKRAEAEREASIREQFASAVALSNRPPFFRMLDRKPTPPPKPPAKAIALGSSSTPIGQPGSSLGAPALSPAGSEWIEKVSTPLDSAFNASGNAETPGKPRTSDEARGRTPSPSRNLRLWPSQPDSFAQTSQEDLSKQAGDRSLPETVTDGALKASVSPLLGPPRASERSRTSSVSSLQRSSQGEAPEEWFKRVTKRRHTIRELVETEKSYASDLAVIRDIYLARARAGAHLCPGSGPGDTPLMSAGLNTPATTWAAAFNVPPSPSVKTAMTPRPSDASQTSGAPSAFQTASPSTSSNRSSMYTVSSSSTSATTANSETPTQNSGSATTTTTSAALSALGVTVAKSAGLAMLSAGLPPQPSPMPAEAPFSLADIRVIFAHLEQSAAFAEEFAAALASAMGEATFQVKGDVQMEIVEDRVGTVFVEMMPRIEKVYAAYCSRHQTSIARLQMLQAEQPKVAIYLAECKELAKGKTTAWDLSSLLIKPVQRILKYPLLLQQIISTTLASHPDYANLQKACDDIQTVAASIDEIKKRKDMVDKIIISKRQQQRMGAHKNFSHGVSKKFFRQKEKVKHTFVGGPDWVDTSEEYRALAARLRHVEVQVQQFSRDAIDWSRSVKNCYETQIRLLEQFKVVYRLNEGDPGVDERIEAFIDVLRRTVNFAWRTMDNDIRRTVIPMVHELVMLVSNPKAVMSKRDARESDFARVKAASTRGEKVDKRLRESAESFQALHAQLMEELPQFLQGVDRLLDVSTAEFARIQAVHFLQVKQNFTEFWIDFSWNDEGELLAQAVAEHGHEGATFHGINVVREFWQSHSAVAEHAAYLESCQPDRVSWRHSRRPSEQSDRQAPSLAVASKLERARSFRNVAAPAAESTPFTLRMPPRKGGREAAVPAGRVYPASGAATSGSQTSFERAGSPLPGRGTFGKRGAGTSDPQPPDLLPKSADVSTIASEAPTLPALTFDEENHLFVASTPTGLEFLELLRDDSSSPPLPSPPPHMETLVDPSLTLSLGQARGRARKYDDSATGARGVSPGSKLSKYRVLRVEAAIYPSPALTGAQRLGYPFVTFEAGDLLQVLYEDSTGLLFGRTDKGQVGWADKSFFMPIE